MVAVLFQMEELSQHVSDSLPLVFGAGADKALHLLHVTRKRLLVLVIATEATMIGGVLDKG
jgi:hypothetical protein